MAINTELVGLMLQAVNPLFVIYWRSLNWDSIFCVTNFSDSLNSSSDFCVLEKGKVAPLEK